MTEAERAAIDRLNLGKDDDWVRYINLLAPRIRRMLQRADEHRATTTIEETTSEMLVMIVTSIRKFAGPPAAAQGVRPATLRPRGGNELKPLAF